MGRALGLASGLEAARKKDLGLAWAQGIESGLVSA